MVAHCDAPAASHIRSLNGHLPEKLLNGHAVSPTPAASYTPLRAIFLQTHSALQSILHDPSAPITVTGASLSIAEVIAAARYLSRVTLTDDAAVREKVDEGDTKMKEMLEQGRSVYGVSTGYGGSANTRTSEHLALGTCLLQDLHVGILSTSGTSIPLTLLDPLSTTTMPESWVRAAIIIRLNSLVRGHSGVQWSTASRMVDLLNANITPCVPVRGSISASGDLQPLSYVASTMGGNPNVRAYYSPATGSERVALSAPEALKRAGLEPHKFSAKDHLGILNGTAFSAAVSALALFDLSHHLHLAQVLTALATEALCGTRGSHHPFIHAAARPHPGQIEVAENMWKLLEGSGMALVEEAEREVGIEEDRGRLRQDRYPLRTSPQWVGPHVEEAVQAWETVTRECNSTTDNPLIDPVSGQIHHGGNFQALALTLSMESARLTCAHLGKLLFTQCTELMNPAMNRGLPPNLATSDPSLNYGCKGLDIACAAYVSELGWLANPVSTHVQSAEMHNQSVNSLALISGRQTLASLDLLSMLGASYLYVLCQAVDVRAQQLEFFASLHTILSNELVDHFLGLERDVKLHSELIHVLEEKWEATSSMDAEARMSALAASLTTPLVDHLISHSLESRIAQIPAFRMSLSSSALATLQSMRESYLFPHADPISASPYLASRTRKLYEYVRLTLGVPLHGRDNWRRFKGGLAGLKEETIGAGVTKIYEAIRDGRLSEVVVGIFNDTV